MRTVTATQLRARLGEVLNRASAGERILIERDHRPLAVLVSPEEAARLDEPAEARMERARRALERLEQFRQRMAREHPHLAELPDSAMLVRQERDSGHGDHG